MKPLPYKDERGYTLIELTVVVILIGLILSITIPRFRYAILTDNLKSTTRKLTGITKNLRIKAIREQKNHTLYFDLESNQIWAVREQMTEKERLVAREEAFLIPSGVQVLDIWIKGEGKHHHGEASLGFNKHGYIQESAIHLASEDGRNFTLILNQFSDRVKIIENYVEIEDG